MDPTVGVIIAAVASALAGVIASILTNRVAGRAQRDSAVLKWAEQLQSSETAARREAQESRDRAERIRDEADADVEAIRNELNSLKNELREATSLAARLADTLTQVAAEVWRPEPDVDALRRLVGRPGASVNGRTY